MRYFGYGRFLVGCAHATNQTLKVENQIRKSLGLLILTAFRSLASTSQHNEEHCHMRVLI
ncbi:uncharacterized protein K444DRAFT_229517 [Hyaloscypha bicolor E]|uniref:Uncharacterized protein n=1 Tax=Hyaloscypha bicolor E TaxID=1095630 RepID=A0A2J6SKN1_9HELO|nr:uncharacterized protein K444DRAFT_229517 [Hyaloscypha bicolor E]PMD51341.1 hypothetical protein K444DRAFT_229517 [Hyaloscypha bicolor E]